MNKVVLFFKESYAELKKVVWPSRQEVVSSTWIVIISTLIFAGVLGLVDFLLILLMDVISPAEISLGIEKELNRTKEAAYTEPLIQEEKGELILRQKNEGFRTAGDVQYVACGGYADLEKYPFKGSVYVMRTILAYDYTCFCPQREGVILRSAQSRTLRPGRRWLWTYPGTPVLSGAPLAPAGSGGPSAGDSS